MCDIVIVCGSLALDLIGQGILARTGRQFEFAPTLLGGRALLLLLAGFGYLSGPTWVGLFCIGSAVVGGTLVLPVYATFRRDLDAVSFFGVAVSVLGIALMQVVPLYDFL